jgi:hypothetical protein
VTSNDPREDPNPKRLDRAARSVLGWIASAISNFVQHPLVLIVVFGVAAGGSDEVIQVSGVARWVVIITVTGLVFASLLVLWQSRTRRRSVDLETAVDALQKQIDAAKDLEQINREQAKLHEEQRKADRRALALAARAKIYADVLQDVTHGLDYVVEHRDSLDGDAVQFVERNSLRPTNETFAAELSTDEVRPKIETAIAVRTASGFRVTHASGPFTKLLKEDGGCHTGGRSIEDVLARKAAANFRPGGWHVVPLIDTHPQQYLFILSSVPLEEPEHYALEQQAALIKLTSHALAPAPQDR